ncbi:MAG: hypothetical protein IKR60_01245 [Alphaproteobacteria bacterium]|nr:hypothetical protein [Alphaproteobacteria bacterium]
MKRKKYKWMVYTVLVVLIGAYLFLSLKDITPVAKRIEKDISMTIH